MLGGPSILARILAFGCIGLLLECLFTGIQSVFIDKNKSAVCKTYLWMIGIYGVAGIILDYIRVWTAWPAFVNAFIYLPIIYAVEYSSGWLLRKAIGRCPWDYGKRKYTVHGLIKLDYVFYWLVVAFCFNPFSSFLSKALLSVSI